MISLRPTNRWACALTSLVCLLILFIFWFFLVFRAGIDTCDWPNKVYMHKPIPKTIHRIWDSGPIPDRFKGNWDNCKRINPGYNVTLWNNEDIENLISTHYPWFLPFYKAYPYHMEQLDAGRYFIIYHYGGVYIDMDVDCKLPFDEIFKKTGQDFEVMIGGGLPVGLATSFFVAKALHPFMRFMVMGLQESLGWYISPYWSVMASTGPVYIYVNYLKYPCKDDIFVLAPHLHKKVYMVHEHAGTWHRWDGPIYVWIDRHLKYVFLTIAFLLTLLACFYYRRRMAKNGHPDYGSSPKANGAGNEKLVNGYQ